MLAMIKSGITVAAVVAGAAVPQVAANPSSEVAPPPAQAQDQDNGRFQGEFMDTVLEGAAYNKAIGLPEHAETRSVFVQGDHEYGKIALSSPMNYELPSMVPNAVAPNIGYLAQSFEVRDLAEAEAGCSALGVDVYSPVKEINLPGRGACRAMIVRNPGSGALQEIFERTE